MKIFNLLHNEEIPDGVKSPLWIIMPDSAIVRSGNPFFVPDFDSKFSAFPALAVKISRLGKSVAPKFAHRYYHEVTAAVTIRATNLLQKLREAGMPWDKAAIFDKCCMIGDFKAIDDNWYPDSIRAVIGSESYTFIETDLKEQIDTVISAISQDNILKIGDIVIIPLTPDGTHLKPLIDIHAAINNETLLEIKVK